MTVASCSGPETANPFLSEWDTPYGIPDFAKIKNEHYIPAIQAGIREQQEEILAIVNNPEAPDFANTIEAYERSGAILERVTNVLFNLSESDVTPELQAVVEEALPLLSEHGDNIFMDKGLYDRVDVLFRQAGLAAEPERKPDGTQEMMLVLTLEQRMVLKEIHEAFVRNGVALDSDGQERMKEINKSLAVLQQKFGNNVLAANNRFEQEFGVSISEYPEAMASTSDRALRERMFKAYSTRCQSGDSDNLDIAMDIMRLQIEKAQLLGYESPADLILSDKMAASPETVDKFLGELMPPAVAKAKCEIADMQMLMDADIKAGLLPAGSEIEAWDWAYYAEKVRKQKYDLDEDALRPYFKMENVREGVFKTAGRLYGLNFRKLEDAPVYHPEVEVFEVTDSDASLVGYLMTDYFPRDTKRGGAWMSNFRNQMVVDGKDIRPVVVNVGNFAKPSDGKPSLLTVDQVNTMFHEFGHALHGLLSRCRYKSVSGTSVARDFVEFPSQINENWALRKEVLADYAFHYRTGEVIPDSLVNKISAARTFNQGFMTTELVAASILDMKWHELTSLEGVAPLEFEAKVCREMGLIDEIIPRYRTSYFAHIFSGGYNAGYYSYLWAEVLDKDAFELFLEKGIFDKETAMSFRHCILEKGGSEDPMALYRRFRGAEPDPDALLRARGLK